MVKAAWSGLLGLWRRRKTVSVADSASGTPGPSQEAGSPRSSVSTASARGASPGDG